MPDSAVRYPYGLLRAPQPRAPLSQLLGANLAVMVGELDVDDVDLRQTELALAQGDTRLERAKAYYARGKTAAHDAGLPFGWHFHIVPGAGHQQAAMAAAAAPLLLDGVPP